MHFDTCLNPHKIKKFVSMQMHMMTIESIRGEVRKCNTAKAHSFRFSDWNQPFHHCDFFPCSSSSSSCFSGGMKRSSTIDRWS